MVLLSLNESPNVDSLSSTCAGIGSWVYWSARTDTLVHLT